MQCAICEKNKAVPYGKYCPRCRKFVNVPRDQRARVAALISHYDKSVDGFRCHYTGIVCDEEDHHSPFYLTFDHRIPNVKGDLLVTIALVNSMKTDLSDEEFRHIIPAMANYWAGAPPLDRKDIIIRHYHRLVGPSGTITKTARPWRPKTSKKSRSAEKDNTGQ